MKQCASLLLGLGFALSISASPRTDYMIHCMGCHMMNGQGMPPEVPAFNSTLGDIVSKAGGRAYLVQVPGASQSPLDNERLAKVLNWVLREYSHDSLPTKFKDISTAEVDQLRPTTLTNPALIREQLLTH